MLEKWTKDRCVGLCFRRQTLEEKKHPCLKTEHNITEESKITQKLLQRHTIITSKIKKKKKKKNYPLWGCFVRVFLTVLSLFNENSLRPLGWRVSSIPLSLLQVSSINFLCYLEKIQGVTGGGLSKTPSKDMSLVSH